MSRESNANRVTTEIMEHLIYEQFNSVLHGEYLNAEEKEDVLRAISQATSAARKEPLKYTLLEEEVYGGLTKSRK